MKAPLQTEAELRHQIWRELQLATHDRHHEWRTPVLATLGAHGVPQALGLEIPARKRPCTTLLC
ncbi:MAG: hypothetical protein GZ093_04215 [Rhodoferax sp.]|uniref:hypothetical protein n=1 Tax=Rhodoferax sp. TaxID=50421 RepID=UPI0013FEA7B9|nr:hypothetical protein [Rhodoferax sp.]NDP37939.1 hypothetical protein [Rhodoferax sp.]